MKKYMLVTMPDGSQWSVPTELIAKDRAEYYAKEFDGDVARSLSEDTLPLFDGDEYEIEDWASYDMNWDDVKHRAQVVTEPVEVDYQEGWVNGDKEFSDDDPPGVQPEDQTEQGE